MLTLASNMPKFGVHGMLPTIEQGTQFRQLVETFFGRLAGRVFGEGRFKQPIQHATFFERHTKFGVPTFWHSHSLISVADSFAERCAAQIEGQWLRLTRIPTEEAVALSVGTSKFDPVTEEMGGALGAARYVTKYSHANDSMFLMNITEETKS